jgi:glycogen operon protein
MGDEVRRTQSGNNNAYCHDDETTWFDWTMLEKHRDLHRFVSLLLARRALRDDAPERHRVTLSQLLHDANKAWHGVRLNQPDWGDDSHSLALMAEVPSERVVIHCMFNAYWEPLDFDLPSVARTGDSTARPWRRWIDTSLDSPLDIVPWQDAPCVAASQYRASPRSVVVLIAESGPA